MSYQFNQIINRQNTHSTKWSKFNPQTLPFWVADMDIAAPDFVMDPIRERLEHPIIGYTDEPESLTEAFSDWLEHHYQWQVPAHWIVWVPGVVPMLNLAARTIAPDGQLLVPTPVYYPFLRLAENADITDLQIPLTATKNARGLWQMDFDAMEAALTPATQMMVICNPQNPTGRCYSRAELSALARFIEKHNLLLVTDEIHCNILLSPDARHYPIAGLFPEIADRTISLYAATKVYNIPGLTCAAAIIPNAQIRKKFTQAKAGLLPGISPLSYVASEAAFRDRTDWVAQLMQHLRQNLADLSSAVGDRLSPIQATYLAWISIKDLALDDPESYFARAGLGISPGAQFGDPDFIRFNFGCPQSTLHEGLDRLKKALNDAPRAY